MPKVAEPLPAGAVVRPVGAVASDAIACFDVFDTVLTRRIGEPHSLFLLLGRRLHARGVLTLGAEAFAHARREANGRAHRNNGAGCTLAQIYDELQFALGWSDELRDAVQAEEVALEHEVTVAIPRVEEKLAEMRTRHGGLTFLSDMYLDGATIRSLLATAGLAHPDDRLYVSSEIGCGKRNGAAFTWLATTAGVPVQRIRHHGNNLRVDVGGARAAGATPLAWLDGNMNRYEEALEQHAAATEGLASVMAGASRIARLAVPAESPHLRALRDVAAGVGGPVIVGYVLWLLLRARELGLRRLYFLSRDGRLLMQVAERLKARLGFDCELRYLHGGRRAWFMATVHEATPADLFWAIPPGSGALSVREFVEALELDPADIEDALAARGLPRQAWERPTPPEELWAIAGTPAVRDVILDRAVRRRQAAIAYLQQEGLFEPVDFGIVDIGWSGRALGALERIVGEVGGSVPHAFFLARFRDHVVHGLTPRARVHTWFADYVRGHGYRDVINELHVELFCGDGEGATLGYEPAGDGVRPVLRSADNPRLAEWGLRTVHDTILAFADALHLDGTCNTGSSMRRPAADVLQLFTRSPSVQEARAWGTYPYEHGRLGERTEPLAAPLSWRHLPELIRHGRIRKQFRAQWPEAAMAMTPPLLRGAVRASLALRRRLVARAGRLRNRFGRRRVPARAALESAG